MAVQIRGERPLGDLMRERGLHLRVDVDARPGWWCASVVGGGPRSRWRGHAPALGDAVAEAEARARAAFRRRDRKKLRKRRGAGRRVINLTAVVGRLTKPR